MKEVRTEIEIHASARKVWDIVSDFSRYSEWNPFIMRAQGEPREGSKITIDVRTPAGAHRTYNPRVIKAEPEKELRWVGKVPGIVSGEHSLTIEQLDGNRVRLANNEVFGGLLSSFFGGSIEDIKAGFEQMNQALKKRAEG